MWFEAVFVCCAGIIMICTDQRGHKSDQETKMRSAACVFVPILCLFLYGRRYSVTELLAGYLLLVLFLAGKRLSVIKGTIFRIGIYGVKVSICIFLYVFVVNAYTPEEHAIAISREEACSVFIVTSAILFLSEKIKAYMVKKSFYTYNRLVFLLVPFVGFYMIESPYNINLDTMSLKFVTGNILLLAFLLILLYCFLGLKVASGLFLTVCVVFGVANYYVGRFRGSPVMPSDLLSINTAFQVAGGYEFEITKQILSCSLLWYAAIALLCCLPESQPVQRWKIKTIACSVVLCVCCNEFLTMNIEVKYDWQLNPWDITGAYWTTGSLFGFKTLLDKLDVAVPGGYNRDKTEDILAAYKTEEGENSLNPTIIVIMDETFSDLHILGDFVCSSGYLDEWDQTNDFVYKGNLFVSVHGGWTANSEFEFLTGCSMGNCAMNTVPYQSYNLKKIGNMADILKNQGYQAIAVHPEYKGNWNRMRVYGNFGFDDFLGKDDFENPEYIRSHISDHSSFEKVIELYEKNQKGKQFIFNVTMQNHGGYNIEELKGMDTITLKGEGQEFSDVETYLTLIRESDRAIHDLIEYFRNVNDPVVICIFGDHLPAVNETWMEQVMGKKEDSLSLEELERRYAVPYMIWANYDTACQQKELDTSANYLGALLLDQADIPRTAYTNFLLHMQEEVPVINVFGYQTKDGQWHSFEEETEVSGWVEQYRMLQYYTMFDSARKMEYYR